MIDHYDLYAVHILQGILTGSAHNQNQLYTAEGRQKMANLVYDMVDSMYAIRQARKEKKS